MTDTFWADVSYYQAPVNDSYPHPVLAFRSNDGTYRDTACAHNLDWSKGAADSGKLACFIVYLVYRQNWQDTLNTCISMIGAPHPKMAVMIDVESWGGQIGGDQSDGINRLYWGLADWLGNKAKVIAYGGTSDLDTLWPTKPDGVRLVIANYGRNPDYPGRFAHQYTDGQGYGGGLPEGAPPFGNCDMNCADNMSPADVAAVLGIGTTPASPATPTTTPGVDVTPDECRQAIRDVLNEQAPTRVPGSTVTLGLGDCIRNTDAAAYIALHALTDPIPSAVSGSTYSAPPAAYWANADAYGYTLSQQVPQLVSAVQALEAKFAGAGSAAVPAGDVAAELRNVLATLTLNAKVA